MMGLMRPTDQPALLEQMPGMMTGIWGGSLYMIAEVLGVEIDETREVYRRWPAPEEAAPDWPRPELDPVHANRIEIEGSCPLSRFSGVEPT